MPNKTAADIVKEFEETARLYFRDVGAPLSDEVRQAGKLGLALRTALRRAMESVVVEEMSEKDAEETGNYWNAARTEMLGNIKKFFV